MKYIISWVMMLCLVCTSKAANYLTFTSQKDGSTFHIVNDDSNNPDVQYSLDEGKTWNELAENETITLGTGGKALLRGNNPNGFSFCESSLQYTYFVMSGSISASGSVMSLIDNLGDADSIPSDYCFYRLFYNCSSLTQAPELPATKLTSHCYSSMFFGTGLTQIPALPASTLAECCYSGMFTACQNLTTIPTLPATTLANSCYFYMFSNCENLVQASVLPATELANYCYNGMFFGCKNLKVGPVLPATTMKIGCYYRMFSRCYGLVQAPALPAPTLDRDCYYEMFDDCTSLRYAPALPASTLAEECYCSMFYNCTSLNQAPALPATTLASRCYRNMFYGCSGLAWAPELPATKMEYECYNCMFNGCTGLTIAPVLPATTLADDCYEGMFKDCTSLKEPPVLTVTDLDEADGFYCYNSMFDGCTGLTKAPVLPATVLDYGCYGYMFRGCSKLSEIVVYFDDWGEESSFNDWVKNVAPTGTFYCPDNLSIEYGTSRIPEGWTVKSLSEYQDGVEKVANDQLWKVQTIGRTLYVTGVYSTIEVYDPSGHLLARKQGNGGEEQITLPQNGIYLVKVGLTSKKVFIQE